MAGNTYFIAQRATGENACVVGGDYAKGVILNFNAAATVYTAEEFLRGDSAGKLCKTLFVDDPTMVFAETPEDLFFKAAAAAGVETVVCLGF